MALHLNKLASPSRKKNVVPSLVEIGPVVVEKKMKIGKMYRQIDRHMPDEKLN